MESIFNSAEEEAKRLTSEIHELKGILREVSQKLTRVETRVRRAFPSSVPKQSTSQRSRRPTDKDEPSMSPEQALQMFDEMVVAVRDGKGQDVRDRLSSMNPADLAVLQRELGIPLGRKTRSINALVQAISSRIHESVMLSRHTSRSQILKESNAAQERSG